MNNLERLILYYLAGRVYIPKPRYMIYNATLRCDLFCRHCGIWSVKKREEMRAEELERIINGDFFDRVETVWLTGGEPTIREDLRDLIRVFKGKLKGMRVVGIASNGYSTVRIKRSLEEIISELDSERHGLFVQISLDGIGGVADEIRGKEGVFERVDETVREIRALKDRYKNLKIELGFNCVIQRRNVFQLKEIGEYAKRNDASLTFNIVEITDQYYCNNERAGELVLTDDDKEKVKDFLRELISESAPAMSYQYKRILAVLSGRKRDRRCLSLYSTFVIDADGTWIPCPLSSEWMRVNFKEKSPERFWRSKEAKAVRRRVERDVCGGCMLSCSLGDSLSIREFLAGGF